MVPEVFSLVEQCAMLMASTLRFCGSVSFKSQMKKAHKVVPKPVIMGEDEVATKTVGIKFLREDRPQQRVAQEQLADVLTEYFKH